jgi:biotin carboxyl carrier protein
MHGRIQLLDKYYDVSVTDRSPRYLVQIADAEPRRAVLDVLDSVEAMVQLGEQRLRVRVRVKGEMVYVRALGQTFDLKIVNPVEQAGRSVKTSSNKARSPMPGVVVDIHVTEGEHVVKGQPMMTIESMKILNSIPAPRRGKVGKIHFAPGQPFDKGAVLVTLCPEEES